MLVSMVDVIFADVAQPGSYFPQVELRLRKPCLGTPVLPLEFIVLTRRNVPDQARIVGLNAHLYLKVGGGVVVSVKANCIDSTAAPEAVFAREVQKMKEEWIKPFEQLTLEPFERGEY